MSDILGATDFKDLVEDVRALRCYEEEYETIALEMRRAIERALDQKKWEIKIPYYRKWRQQGGTYVYEDEPSYRTYSIWYHRFED